MKREIPKTTFMQRERESYLDDESIIQKSNIKNIQMIMDF